MQSLAQLHSANVQDRKVWTENAVLNFPQFGAKQHMVQPRHDLHQDNQNLFPFKQKKCQRFYQKGHKCQQAVTKSAIKVK